MQRMVKRIAWRLGRRLYCWGRGDLANNADSNGERWLRGIFIGLASEPVVLLDIGANRGDWSVQAIAEARAARRPLKVHAFEPSTPTRELLQRALAGFEEAEISKLALSSANGEADFFSNGVASGTNSLSSASGNAAERVEVRTLDAFVQERRLGQLGMVKIDTEGFDLEVLKGAVGLLTAGQIELVQFEYNWRWLLNRASLRQVFELIDGMPYRFGKLTGESIVFHDRLHFELDRYFENNYVLVRNGSLIQQLGKKVRFDAHNVGL